MASQTTVLTDKATAFVQEALNHVGEGPQWSWKTYGMANVAWCAEFVASVAKVTGILGKCIYHTAMAEEHARSGVRSHMGIFYLSKSCGGSYVPVVGDLILFRRGKARVDQYTASHIGIVIESKDGIAYTVEGNTGSGGSNSDRHVLRRNHSLSAGDVIGYFHPTWKLADGLEPTNSYTGQTGSISGGQLYSNATTKQDMTVREIGYLDSSLQPSITSSGISLSVINYTGVLSSIFKVVAPSINAGNTDTDQLSGNCRIAVSYLLGKGLNCAAACGVAANIQGESNFRTNAVNPSHISFGICQWTFGRATNMKKYVGEDWAVDLSGQLDFLWKELTGGYKHTTLEPIQKVSNTVAGTQQSADIFVRHFEQPDHVDLHSMERQKMALNIFNQCVIMKA